VTSQLRIALDQERGLQSLARFVRLAWNQVEPNKLVWNWHMDAMCQALELVSRGRIRKLLINIPPGMSKSLIVSTFWPVWDWLQCPTRRFIFASYAQDISDKNAKLHRDLVLSDWFQVRWGAAVSIGAENAKRVREFHNDQKGWRFSTSVGGQVTGRHGDVLCFDDLVKAQDAEGRNIVDPAAIAKANDFWFKTMHTRRADPATTIHVGIMQRLHHEDASAQCLKKGGYVHLNLPMEYAPTRRCSIYDLGSEIKSTSAEEPEVPEDAEVLIEDRREEEGELLNPERFPPPVVEEDREVLGPATHEAQMNQNPTRPEGQIFKVASLQTWILEPPKGLREIITVDCSFKDTKGSDLVAIQSWGVKNPNYYLIDQILGRFNVMKTMEMIGEMKDRRPRSVGIYVEDKANGSAVMQILGDTIPGLIAWNPGTASKVSRAEAVAPLVEAGNVYTPDPSVAHWVQPYKTALGRFPLIAHDDEIDATTMALLILHKPRHRRYRDAVRKMFANRD
jgi:predicted phage terminase large subunit-like protein